jgi:glycosyltransferase involved in cell wall biosynthesis
MARTLASVQAQTYPNIVHVILDNASADVTPALIRRAQGGPVRLLTARNETALPQVDNWNAAMAMVPPEARYVKLLPADDLMSADCIEKMVALAESDPEVDFVTAIESFDGEMRVPNLDPALQVYDGPDFARKCLRWEVRWIPAAHVFFRASPERLSRPYRPDCHPIFDKDFVFEALLDRKVGVIFEPLLYTRYDERTVTAQAGGYRGSLIGNLLILQTHGPKFLGRAETARRLKREYLGILRHVARWTLKGEEDFGRRTLARLRELGFRADKADMARALLGYPLHVLAKPPKAANGPVSERREESWFLPASTAAASAAE